MSIRLDVPLHGQHTSNDGWLAASLMIARYFRPGPGLPLPRAFAASAGFNPDGEVGARGYGLHVAAAPRVARAEGLVPVQYRASWTSEALENLIVQRGPIWCAGSWDKVGQVLVLTGVNGTTLYFNDPDGPQKRQEGLEWFNQGLFPMEVTPDAMMFRDVAVV